MIFSSRSFLPQMAPILTFQGSAFLRQRLILATLSGRAVRIQNIRSDNDDQIGLTEFEISFIQLLEKLTNGSNFEISYTGTSLVYKPGNIVGGSVEHDCGTDRPISYFLEPVIALAPFSKNPFRLSFTGITNDPEFVSVDLLRTVFLPQLKRFGIAEGVELKITKRGAPPLGGGEIYFKCPIVKQLAPVQFIDEGRIKRIRGLAYAARVSPQNVNRMVESARSLLNRFIPDVYIYSDVYKGEESGKSPGFAVALVAETTTGALLSAERVAKGGETPEDIGIEAAKLLYNEISLGGCVDTVSQWINMLFMTLCPEDVSKIRIGKLSSFSIQFLRDLRDFFGITFKIDADASSKTVVLTGVGTGYINMNKKTT